MEIVHRIQELISPTLKARGFDVVRVLFYGEKLKTLQIMIEKTDVSELTVDDCAECSTAISAILDVEDLISSNYELEVSSPGIDRPLTRLTDFDRFSGFEAKVETQNSINGRRRFQGALLGIDGKNIVIEVDRSKTLLPFSSIKSAKLVLNDALIDATRKERRV
tara:strand:- start:15710 stop:16201 length:492 start_codon:yes stop_codon:yes gene_type:complete